MDTERDGLIDQEELEAGLRKMFPPTTAHGGPGGHEPNPFGAAVSMNPAELFGKIDADGQGRLVLSDFEIAIMPKIRQILSVSNVNKTTFPLTLSEMTGNVAFFVMKKIDADKNGFVEMEDLARLKQADAVSYELIEDLFTLAPDFMDKHRQVINGSGKASASGASSPQPK